MKTKMLVDFKICITVRLNQRYDFTEDIKRQKSPQDCWTFIEL